MDKLSSGKIKGIVLGAAMVIICLVSIVTGKDIISSDSSSDKADSSSKAAVTTAAPKAVTTKAKTVTTAQTTNIGGFDIVTEVPNKENTEYYFRTKKLRDQHYEKHGIEMGFSSADEYRRAASDVINDPSALTKTEKEDGDTCYYIEATDEFVVLSTDGYIRTYFNPGGKAYFDRQ